MGAQFWGSSRSGCTTTPSIHAWHAAKHPTSATHQHPRTALQHKPTNMFLTPLGVVFQPLLTALNLGVPVLSCTQPKMSQSPFSFGAITLSRLLLSAPAQWLQVPHHPGCHEKSLDFSPRLAGFQAQIQTSTGSFEWKNAPTCPFMRFPFVSPPCDRPPTHCLVRGACPQRAGR